METLPGHPAIHEPDPRRRLPIPVGIWVLVVALWACGPGDAPPPSSSPAAPSLSEDPLAEDPRAEDSRAEDSRAEDLVLITVDTLRFDAVGFSAAGSDEPGPWHTPTPTLDRWAAEGRVFTRAVAHAPLTLPSHAALLTGLFPYQSGVRENAGFVLGEEARTLAEILGDAGWSTGAFVSAFVLDSRFGLAQGFDVYGDRIDRGGEGGGSFGVSERRGDETVAEALAWWREHAGEKRFLWLHLFDPHAPYAAPEPWASRFEEPYRAEVAAMDAFLEPLARLFDEAPAERRPLVVFTSDHGEALGDHGELTHGILAYQSTLQVPLLARGPGVEPGRDDRLARHVDVMPTMLRAAGLDVPSDLPGRSLLDPPKDGEAYFEALSGALNRGWAPLRGVIRGSLKYVDLPLPELYDLDADPGETRNLADERRRDLRALRDALPAESRWPPARAELSAEESARLRSLGYVTGDGGSELRFTPDDDPKRLMDLDRDIHRFSELFAAGDPAAIEVARSLVRRRPSMAVGHTQLAVALLEFGRRDEALAAMEEARRAGAAGPTLLLRLGLTLTEAGRADEAVGVLRPLADAGDPEALGALAVALSGVGELDRAQERMTAALDRAPDDGGLHEKAAVLALMREDPAAALAHARRATELSPSSAPAWNHLGVALFLQGRPLEALEAWQRSVSLDGDQFDTLYNLGIKAAELGRPDLARRALADFVARAPRDRYAEDLPRVRALLRELGP